MELESREANCSAVLVVTPVLPAVLEYFGVTTKVVLQV